MFVALTVNSKLARYKDNIHFTNGFSRYPIYFLSELNWALIVIKIQHLHLYRSLTLPVGFYDLLSVSHWVENKFTMRFLSSDIMSMPPG